MKNLDCDGPAASVAADPQPILRGEPEVTPDSPSGQKTIPSTVTAKHPDAVGYLKDLADEVNESWFRMICDLAAATSPAQIDPPTFDRLLILYTEKASYVRAKSPPVDPIASVAATSTDYLEGLTGFASFKHLGETLEVGFAKRITLIFGSNGSGKSSLCECLKALASPDRPKRPLENVRERGAGSPTFCYKFRSDAVQQTWTTAVGYGSRQRTIRYFDSSIAVGNVRNAVDLGRVVVLTPFRLSVFDSAKALTANFREGLQRVELANSTTLAELLAGIRTEFARFPGCPLATVADTDRAVLAESIRAGKEFAGSELLAKLLVRVAELEKATSDEGVKLLRAEQRELDQFLANLRLLMTATSELWELEPASKAKALSEKQIAQEAIARALIPDSGTLDGLMAMLRAVSPMCDLASAAGSDCPLCRRSVGAPEVELFRLYHGLLQGDLERDIAALRAAISVAVGHADTVKGFDQAALGRSPTIPSDLAAAVKAAVSVLVMDCDVSSEPSARAREALGSLQALEVAWSARLEAKKNALDTLSSGRQELLREIAELRQQVAPLEYAQAVADRLIVLEKSQALADKAKFWRDNLPAMTPLLKKITDRAKDAYEDLVVKDFHTRLNSEYLALAEKGMASFGVTLVRKGVDAAVTVLPQVGGNDIEYVLSEGEQRLHALALFFAELESSPQSVLVFDDPVSSFDCDYTANFCGRLRDVTLKHSDRQIIVFTHNWEFFVQLQLTFNQARLHDYLSVQVLENCALIAEYSDKIADLTSDIEAVLNTPGVLSKAQAAILAGKMRRLIESVVNTHVFNQQRYQFRQRSQAVSGYREFTKLIPLLPDEATLLGDLFSRLSPFEHDDQRTEYVNVDKAVFQTRYDQIRAVEHAITNRPPQGPSATGPA